MDVERQRRFMMKACRLVSRTNSQGSGMTWWIVRPDGSAINTLHASNGRERFYKDQMEGILTRERNIWNLNSISVVWSGRKSF